MRGQPITLNTQRDVNPAGLADGDSPVWDAASKTYKMSSLSGALAEWKYDEFAGNGTTAGFTLTFLPHGVNVVFLKSGTTSTVMRQGAEWSVNFSTGLVSFATPPASGVVIAVSYVTTGTLANTTHTDVSSYTYRGSANAFGTGSTSSCSPPASLVDGDTELAFVITDDTSGITPPSGWGRLAGGTGTGLSWGVWSKIAASDVSDVWFSTSNTAKIWVAKVAYAGTLLVDVIGTVGHGTSTAPSAPGLSPVHPSDLLVAGYMAVVPVFAGVSPPAGMNNRTSLSGGLDLTLSVADLTLPTNAATSAETGSMSSSGEWVALQITLH